MRLGNRSDLRTRPALEKLAIVESGIAGLGVAYFLNDRYELTIFEEPFKQSLRVGGPG
jgi:predicted NAD/FAD-binding protein